MIGKNRIIIYGPKDDGTYVVEFRAADGNVLAISIPRTEARVVRHFQERMPTACSCRIKHTLETRDMWPDRVRDVRLGGRHD